MVVKRRDGNPESVEIRLFDEMGSDMPVPGGKALHLLKEGNRRFWAASHAGVPTGRGKPGFLDLSAGQEPFAAILACSDSRVPVETIFDQGPGQLFVVRVAGNVIGQTQLGSLEFAVEVLRVRLILVLGHTGCGAVAAALAPTLVSGKEIFSRNLGSITSRISRILDRWGRVKSFDNQPRSAEVERLHAWAVAKELVLQSELLAHAVRSAQLLVAGSIYDLETGLVEFIDEGSIRVGGRRGPFELAPTAESTSH